jgi:hypothetical protein
MSTALFMSLSLATSLALAAVPAPQAQGLVLDLDADKGVETKGSAVLSWQSQANFKARDFKATRADGKPELKKALRELRGHNSVVFHRKELIGAEEDAFDHLTTGSGYTWCVVLAAYKQNAKLKDVNTIFGNLRNGGQFEGFWANLNDDNSLWIGSRNGWTFGRWNADNPKVDGPKLEEGRYYVVAGRMGAGTGTVAIELFVNDPQPVAKGLFPVNPKANPSKLAIGQERDATNHPGVEAFDGEIARLLLWDRPLSDAELADALKVLKAEYGVK